MTTTPTEWSDRFSPMLIKELRQGMSARTFVSAFLAIQGVMMFILISLVSAAQATDHDSVNFSGLNSGLFWTVISVPLLLVMPLRGLNAVGGEIKANTLELIFLTRLSAWRIVTGKWLALVSQSVLLVAAILPYVLLRYFIGGINLTEDLLVLAALLVGSALLTGLSVAASSFSSRFARGLIAFGFFTVGGPSLSAMSSLFGARFGSSWGSALLLLCLGSIGLLLLLEIAAERISPPAEDHTLRKRLLGVLAVITTPLLGWAGAETRLTSGLMLAVVTFICIDALAENWKPIRSIYEPYVRRGLAGRWFGRLFYPGWISAIHYTVLIIPASFGWWGQAQGWSPKIFILMTSLLGGLFLPVILIRGLLPQVRQTLLLFGLFQLVMGMIAIFAAMLIKLHPNAGWITCIFPTTVLLLQKWDGLPKGGEGFFLTVETIIAAVSWLILWLLSRRSWSQVRTLESEAFKVTTTHQPSA